MVDYQLSRWSNSYSGTGSGVLGSTCELWSSPGESSGGPRAGATRGASMGSPRWPRMALTEDGIARRSPVVDAFLEKHELADGDHRQHTEQHDRESRCVRLIEEAERHLVDVVKQ